MFGIFKKKSQLEKLQDQHSKLMEESFKLSKSDRKASDAKQAEAFEIEKKIEAIQEKSS